MEKQALDQWAIVALMGHQQIAGRVTEAELGGGKLLRIDVPEVDGRQALTRFFGTAAIYDITFVSEETARAFASRLRPEPIAVWDARTLLEKSKSSQPTLPGETDDEDDDGPRFVTR